MILYNFKDIRIKLEGSARLKSVLERIKVREYLTKAFLAFLFISSFLVGALGSYLYLKFSRVFVRTTPVAGNRNLEVITPTRSYNILLLGYGGAGHEGGILSDAILVVNVNPVRKKASLISIPRDLWVEIPVRSDISQNLKINHAYAIGSDDRNYPLKEPQYKGEDGGSTLAKEVVGKITGMEINYFIAVDFEGFKKIIDILGGVEVDVPVAFDDYFYPIKGRENDTCGKTGEEIAELHELYSDTELHHQFECRYEHIHFDAGIQKMDGETALKFVRSRASSQHGGDFARSERQQAVLLGIKDRLISMDAVKNLDEVFDQFAKMLKTDVDLKTAKDLLDLWGDPEEYTISFISLNEDNVLVSTKSLDGQFILIPKEGEGVWNGVQSYLYEQINR